MTSKTCTLSVTLLLTLGFTVAAEEIRGVVVKANPAGHELTVEVRGRKARHATMTFMVDKETQITEGPQTIKLADIAAGRHVRVTYEIQAGEPVATRVKVMGALLQGAGGLPGPGGAPLPPPAPVKGEPGAITGVLRRVAITDHEIVVVNAGPKGGPEMETTILVPDATKITRNQKPIRFQDLKEGEQVSVSVDKKDRKLFARSIQVGAVAGVMPPPQPNAPPNGNERIQRIREILKMVDGILQRLDERDR
jgi:hypothetical protein